jgi:histone acetyltransferase (RNA polymerase elongator complex component)
MSHKKSLFIIPIFLPHQGCPHQCTFCNQNKISGSRSQLPSRDFLTKEINNYLSFKRDTKKTVQIAFYGGNFLGLPLQSIITLLDEAEKFIHVGKVDSIRFSTRPDSINNQILELMKNYTVSTIELGAQSMDDKILSFSNRGHTANDTSRAARLIQQQKIHLGLQMMTGLPGDDGSQSLATANQIAALHPDFIRIYPTIVLSNSPLALSYKKGNYSPMPLEESIRLVAKIYTVFTNKNIPVIRMGLQASDGLEEPGNILAGPYHPAFGHMVFSKILLEKIKKVLREKNNIKGKRLDIYVHSTGISKMRGLKNQNIIALKKLFQLESIRVLSDDAIPDDQPVVDITG